MRRRLAAWPKSHSYCAISPQVGSVLAQYPPSPEYWLPPHCECGLIMGPWRTKLYYFNFSIYLLHRDRNQQIEPNQEFRIDPTMMIHRVSYIYVYNDPPPLYLSIHPSVYINLEIRLGSCWPRRPWRRTCWPLPEPNTHYDQYMNSNKY